MNALRLASKYMQYLLFSKTAHGIHSPFVYELVTKVIRNKNNFYAFDEIERLRKNLLLSRKMITVNDFGTGKSGNKTIAEIAERSLTGKKYGQLLFRLAHHLKPSFILELGTSLGIGTAYLASANSKARVITIEGSQAIAEEAKKVFDLLNLKNIEIAVGDFDTLLAVVLSGIPHPVPGMLVYIDGNHRQDAVLKYFEQCLEHAGNASVFVLDDIRWSAGMENVWKETIKHPKVTVSIDLFFTGIVFFRKEQAKEHFVIKY